MTTKTRPNDSGGFPPSVFRCDDMGYASEFAFDGVFPRSKESRILLISSLGSEVDEDLKAEDSKKVKKAKRKRTRNRKEVSKSSVYTFKGVEYKINNAPSYGVYKRIMQRMMEQLDICIRKWKRVFVMRFDLHQKFYTKDNKMVSRFRDNLVRRIDRKYGIYEMGYAWCREQEKAKQQHYHMVIFLDGDKINHSSRLSDMVRVTWEALKAGNTVHIPKNCYYNIRSSDPQDSVKAEVVQRISYLSKQRGKGYRPPQTKDYGTSRLVDPFKFDFQTGASVK